MHSGFVILLCAIFICICSCPVGMNLYGGNYKFISEQVTVSEEMKTRSEQFSEEGKTPLFFARDGALCGIIAVADVIKEDSPAAISEMRNMGIHVVMLTGDSLNNRYIM